MSSLINHPVPGRRVLAILPMRSADEPATVVRSDRRRAGIYVVLDAYPGATFFCATWRLQANRTRKTNGGAALGNAMARPNTTV